MKKKQESIYIKDADAVQLSTRAIAKLLKISERRIRQLVVDGSMVKGDKVGYYVLWDSVHNYLQRLNNNNTPSSVTDEKLKLLTAKRRLMEASLQEKEKSLIPSSQVEQDAAECASAVRDITQQLPGKIRNILGDDNYKLVEEVVEAALKDISEKIN